jgi:hypothetical protein
MNGPWQTVPPHACVALRTCRHARMHACMDGLSTPASFFVDFRAHSARLCARRSFTMPGWHSASAVAATTLVSVIVLTAATTLADGQTTATTPTAEGGSWKGDIRCGETVSGDTNDTLASNNVGYAAREVRCVARMAVHRSCRRCVSDDGTIAATPRQPLRSQTVSLSDSD